MLNLGETKKNREKLRDYTSLTEKSMKINGI